MILPYAQYEIALEPRARGAFFLSSLGLGEPRDPVHKKFAIFLQAIVYNRYAVL